MPVRQCTGGQAWTRVEDAVNRPYENANRITLGRLGIGLVLGVGRLVSGLHPGPWRRRHRPRQRPGPGSGHRRFPDLLHPPPDSRRPGQRHARPSVRRRRRLFRHAVEARPRFAGRPRNRAHGAPARPAAGRSGRPIRHQGSLRRARRPARGLRDARPDRRPRRRGRAADLEHLGIQHRDRHAASRDHLGHHRRRRPGRRPVLSTRRPHPVLLDSPAPGQGHPARRGQGAVRSRHRSAQRVRVRACT